MWASGAKIEAGKCGDEPLVGDGVKQVLQCARDMVEGRQRTRRRQAENGETFAQQFGSGKVGMMGTGNFNITLAREQNPDIDLGVRHHLLPGMEPARPPRSSAATSSSSPRAASGSTTRSTS